MPLLAQQTGSLLGDLPANSFRPQSALLWAGAANEHLFSPEQAESIPFPPFSWDRSEFSVGEAWYEFEVPRSAIPDELAGILITRLYLTADIYLNGILIGSGGSMSRPLAKNAHRPLYFSIPETAWQTGTNRIRIHHKSYSNFGYVVDVLVGPDTSLRPVFEERHFRQQSIPKIFFTIEIIAALFLFYFWYLNRQEKAYLWFAISMVMISIFTLNQFLIDTVISHKLWMVIDHTAIDWWAISLILFVGAKLDLSSRPFDRFLTAYALLTLIYYSSLPLEGLPVTIFLHAVSLFLILLYTIYISIYADKKAALPFVLFFSSLLLMALHDLLMQSGVWLIRWLDGYFILFYAAPLACFIVFGNLIREFVIAMQATKSHAANLEMHIALTKRELEEQYEKLNSLTEERAIETERERIYRDLHDDVGSKLLSLFYQANDSRLEILAKSALEDLRDIVSRKTLDGELLETAVKQWEEEVRERISSREIALVWNNTITNEKVRLNESQYTHIKRMIREAISNALRHNLNCTNIEIEICASSSELNISVDNDGLAKSVDHWQHGRGLNNMSIRVRELGGNFAVSALKPGWVRLSWYLPLTPT